MTIAIFISTFITILVAELGDKTQITTLAISGSSNRPLAVFIGSSSALILTSLLGVIIGGSFTQFIPEYILQIAAAIGFLVIGIKLLITSKEENSWINDWSHSNI